MKYGLTRKYSGKPKLTTDYFPKDLDTTSIALTTLRMKDEVAASVLDEMLQYVNSDGLILVGSLFSSIAHISVKK